MNYKFKKGDKVKLIDDTSLLKFGLKVGDIGTVLTDKDNAPWVEWESEAAKYDKIWCAHESKLELIDEK